jgi:hypothetical protein
MLQAVVQSCVSTECMSKEPAVSQQVQAIQWSGGKQGDALES